MVGHAIAVVAGKSKVWGNAFSGRPSAMVRWRCSCGKLGPEQLTKHDEPRARRRAANGGQRHIAAAMRRRKRARP